MKRRVIAVSAALALAFATTTSATDSSAHAMFNWMSMMIDVHVSLNLKAKGLSAPTDRVLAESELFEEYYTKVEDFVFRFPVDSSSTVRDRVLSGALSAQIVNDIISDAHSVSPTLSNDGENIRSDYYISLVKAASHLVTHSTPTPLPHIVAPPTTPAFTGLVIVADMPLPIHGKRESARLAPCIFPRVWDDTMRLILDRTFVPPSFFKDKALVHYADREAIFDNTPSNLSPDLEAIVGDHPLRIIAVAVQGKRPTDPIIAAQDANILLAPPNRAILQSGRIAIICSPEALHADYTE
jgi:hypothetical protein